MKSSPFDFKYLLLDGNNDADKSFFEEFRFTIANYFLTKEAKLKIHRSDNSSFCLIHLNIRII